MYAVIKTGGKQYRVAEGDLLRIESLSVDEGAALEFDQVLMIGDGEAVTVGAPYIDGGRVSATVKAHGRGKKIRIVKFKRRKQYHRRTGHRQGFTEVRITGISAG